MVMAMIFALGPLSGAHFNPAVTVALAVSKRFPWRQVVPYISMQTIGAVLASAMHSVLYGQATAKDAEFGAHIPKVAYSAAFGFEVIYGFLLMLVIMAVATNRQVAAPIPAIAIGLTVTLLIYIGGPLSGGSMNPVRSLAPALFTGGAALNALPIYLFAPLVGSVLAALLYEKLRDEPDDAQSVPANS
jgi:MIP family channel proteins